MDTLLRARTRQATWIFLVIAYVAALIGGVYGVSTPPSTGTTFAVSGSELVMTGFKPGSHVWSEGARTGDIVELINGLPAVHAYNSRASIQTLSFRPVWADPGENVRTVEIGRSPMSLVDETIILNLLGLAFMVMAVLIYLRARRSSETVMFAIMAMSAAVSFAIGPASVANQTWGRVAMGAALYVASISFFMFFFGFTRSDSGCRGWIKIWLPELTVVISAVLVVPWILTAVGIVDLFPVLRPGMFVMLGLSLSGGVALLAYRLKTADRENQEQLRVVTMGTVIGLVPFIWLSIFPEIVTGSEILKGEVAVISFILIPLTFGYAIARHDLMGIRRLFHRGAAYALISAVIIMVYGTVLTGLNLLAPDSDALGPIQGALLVLMFAGAPTLSSVRRKALRIVDRVLYEGAVTQEDLVSAISTVSANQTDQSRVLERAISFTGQGFDVEYAAIVNYGREGSIATGRVEHTYNSPDAAVTEGIASVAYPESRGVVRSVLPGTDQAILIGMLRDVGREQRVILLGPKANDDIFTMEEVSLLETVCAVVSTALTRIRLLDEVREQSEQLKNMGTEMQNLQEIERQEISSYLHDEPLQKLAYALSRIREMELPEDIKGLLEDVATDLRGTSASLSPEMLRSHGLMSALKWMVQDQEHRGPFRTFLEIQGIADNERLPDDIELTVYRAVQEALNNCRKHANAKSVWVKLQRTESQIELAVEDNGVGINTTTVDGEIRSPDQGLGIRGLKQRVGNLGGTLAVLPRSSRGTAFIVTIPLNREQLRAAS